MTRREFALWSLAVVANLAIAVLLAVPVVSCLFGPLLARRRESDWSDVGPADDFRGGLVHEVPVEMVSVSGYTRQRRKRVIYVTELKEVLIAFDAECTHMGCNVSWAPGTRHFECPCHGGEFTREGEVAGGPATRPLRRHPTRVVEQRLQVQLS